jgi:stringent starvation protein B
MPPSIRVLRGIRLIVHDQGAHSGTRFLIVLNIGCNATHQLLMENTQITFNARFSGRVYKIDLPVDNVRTIYAQENGQGMAFPVETVLADKPATDAPSDLKNTADEETQKKRRRAHLSLVK